MAIYRLDIEKRFGQLQLRLYPQGTTAPPFGNPSRDLNGLLEALDEALAPLDTKSNADSVIFREIEYTKKTPLKETVRFSKY